MMILLLVSTAMQLEPSLTFRREPSFHEPTLIEIGTMSTNHGPGYWFRRTLIKDGGSATSWTDTNRCPAARSILRKVRDLQMPRVNVPLLEDDHISVTADGVGYELWGKADYAGKSAYDFRINSNSGTPLAKWVDDSLEKLSSCWSSEKPA